MKFKDIKIDDVVMYQKIVGFGLRRGKNFFIPLKVIRVTPTQFTLEGGVRFKKDGSGIGDNKYKRAFYLGDLRLANHSKDIREEIKDETLKMKSFIRSLNTERKIRERVDEIKMRSNSGLSQSVLDGILEKVNEVITALK